MNKEIVCVLEVEGKTAGTYIAFFVPIGFYDSIDAREHHIVSDIEFSIVIKKRFIDIGLDYKCTCWLFLSFLSCKKIVKCIEWS